MESQTTPQINSGQWVMDNDHENDRPTIGKVKDVYASPLPWETGVMLIDVDIYDHTGRRIGRLSPPCGGPTSYEPSCPINRWVAIEEPTFPIKTNKMGGYAQSLKRI